jgi:hypothetical protein
MQAGVVKRMGWSLAALLAVVCLATPMKAFARHGGDGEDRLGIFSSITVSEDHPAADVVCLFCAVQINGDVHGDVAVLFGSVTVTEGRTISGDVAMLFSSLVVGEGSRINGDLATALSSASVAEGAHVGGDRAVLSSGLGLAVILAPLLIAIGVVWLLVWVVRRVIV